MSAASDVAEKCVWYVEVYDSTGSPVSQGSAVAVRLECKSTQAKTYLLTCAHVLRKRLADKIGEPHGSLLKSIKVWQPGMSYREDVAITASIVNDAHSVEPGIVPQADRNAAAIDWVLLEVNSNEVSKGADFVQWGGKVEKGTMVEVYGYPGGGLSFLPQAVSPTSSTAKLTVRQVVNGALGLAGEGTREGMSGGAILDGHGCFVGLHRQRINQLLQLSGVAATHIRQVLSEATACYQVVQSARTNPDSKRKRPRLLPPIERKLVVACFFSDSSRPTNLGIALTPDAILSVLRPEHMTDVNVSACEVDMSGAKQSELVRRTISNNACLFDENSRTSLFVLEKRPDTEVSVSSLPVVATPPSDGEACDILTYTTQGTEDDFAFTLISSRLSVTENNTVTVAVDDVHSDQFIHIVLGSPVLKDGLLVGLISRSDGNQHTIEPLTVMLDSSALTKELGWRTSSDALGIFANQLVNMLQSRGGVALSFAQSLEHEFPINGRELTVDYFVDLLSRSNYSLFRTLLAAFNQLNPSTEGYSISDVRTVVSLMAAGVADRLLTECIAADKNREATQKQRYFDIGGRCAMTAELLMAAADGRQSDFRLYPFTEDISGQLAIVAVPPTEGLSEGTRELPNYVKDMGNRLDWLNQVQSEKIASLQTETFDKVEVIRINNELYAHSEGHETCYAVFREKEVSEPGLLALKNCFPDLVIIVLDDTSTAFKKDIAQVKPLATILKNTYER